MADLLRSLGVFPGVDDGHRPQPAPYPPRRVGEGREGASARPSAVRQPVFLDPVAVGLEQHLGAAMLADLLGGPLDHAVALARLGEKHLSGGGDLEALFCARLRLQLGHLALLSDLDPTLPSPAKQVSVGWVHRCCSMKLEAREREARRSLRLDLSRLLVMSVLLEHSAATAALQPGGGRPGYGRAPGKWQPPGPQKTTTRPARKSAPVAMPGAHPTGSGERRAYLGASTMTI